MMHGSNSNHEIYMMHPSQNNNKGDNLVMLAAKKLNEFGILYLQQAIDKTTIILEIEFLLEKIVLLVGNLNES